jgi:hypothetical protein
MFHHTNRHFPKPPIPSPYQTFPKACQSRHRPSRAQPDRRNPIGGSALVSAGGEIKWLNGISVLANFKGEFSNNTQSYGGKGTLRYVW